MDAVSNKRTYVKSLLAVLLSLAVVLAFMPLMARVANADTKKIEVQSGDFTFTLYEDDGEIGSVWLTRYVGSGPEVTFPTELVYKGKKYPVQELGSNIFQGNTTITKVTILNSYIVVYHDAFKGCSGLKEVVVGNGIMFIEDNAFTNCPNLKTYRFGFKEGNISDNAGIGKDSSGKIYPGVVAYVPSGSNIEKHLKEQNDKSTGNKIKINPSSNPAPGTDKKNTVVEGNGKDGTPVGPGASEKNADKAIRALSGEKDIKGSVFGLLQAKATSSSKKSVKVTWKKAGAKKFIIYGNKCGGKNKLVKLQTVTKTSMTFKKVNGKKVKKGTYYKFIILALNSKNKVVSTSKAVHVATLGGKVGNDKKVIVKAKVKKKTKAVSKVTIKKGKKITFKCKAVPKKKKLKVKRHRKIAFESGSPKIASVSSKGVVKGLKKGKCKIYAYTQNGIFKAVTVTVK